MDKKIFSQGSFDTGLIDIRVGRFWNFTLVDIGKGYWANIKPCET